MSRTDYLVEEIARLEKNLMQATSETAQIAICNQIIKHNAEIVNS